VGLMVTLSTMNARKGESRFGSRHWATRRWEIDQGKGKKGKKGGRKNGSLDTVRNCPSASGGRSSNCFLGVHAEDRQMRGKEKKKEGGKGGGGESRVACAKSQTLVPFPESLRFGPCLL